MKIHAIDTGLFKLDGGAMFGVVPKTIWNKINPADANNLCTWAMRCMLIEDGNRLILIDNGIGNKQDEKFFGHYDLDRTHSLELSLNKLGFTFSDVTDMVLTHLHFDHCGGSIVRTAENSYQTAFPNATYYVAANQWETAVNPNPREKASFLKENILPIQESGQLKLLTSESSNIHDNIRMRFVNGHTDSMMLPEITVNGHTIVFMADLMPSVGHIKPAWVMAYDVRPLDTMKEREAFNQEAIDKNFVLFFEHDHVNECATLHMTEKGIVVKETFSLNSLLGG